MLLYEVYYVCIIENSQSVEQQNGGYSEIGTPCIVMGNGSWINHILLMATTSLGEKEYLIKTFE